MVRFYILWPSNFAILSYDEQKMISPFQGWIGMACMVHRAPPYANWCRYFVVETHKNCNDSGHCEETRCAKWYGVCHCEEVRRGNLLTWSYQSQKIDAPAVPPLAAQSLRLWAALFPDFAHLYSVTTSFCNLVLRWPKNNTGLWGLNWNVLYNP